MLILGAHRYVGASMVLYCTALHFTWALLILLDPVAATGATAVSALMELFKSDTSIVLVLAGAATLSVVGLFSRLPWMVALCIPQQSLLIISACGAVVAIATSQFADGVIRPQVFIAADQADIILAAMGHAGAIILSAHDRIHSD